MKTFTILPDSQGERCDGCGWTTDAMVKAADDRALRAAVREIQAHRCPPAKETR